MAKITKQPTQTLAAQPPVESLIHIIRGQKVMLDSDLAALYEVPTKVFNQAVRRNSERFPQDFMFLLTDEEVRNLRSQTVTSSWGRSPLSRFGLHRTWCSDALGGIAQRPCRADEH
jgi:ORF6N domain